MDSSYDYSILFSNAFRILRGRAYACLEKYELIPTHWSLIGIVYRAKKGITVSEAALALGVKLPLVTIMVDYLESKQLIDRAANEADGRSKLLLPTKAGARQIKVIEKDIAQSLRPLLEGVSDAELRTFQKVLQGIIDNDSDAMKEA